MAEQTVNLITHNLSFSPADTQLDLEVGFKLFFFTDSCWLDIAIEESG